MKVVKIYKGKHNSSSRCRNEISLSLGLFLLTLYFTLPLNDNITPNLPLQQKDLLLWVGTLFILKGTALGNACFPWKEKIHYFLLARKMADQLKGYAEWWLWIMIVIVVLITALVVLFSHFLSWLFLLLLLGGIFALGISSMLFYISSQDLEKWWMFLLILIVVVWYKLGFYPLNFNAEKAGEYAFLYYALLYIATTMLVAVVSYKGAYLTLQLLDKLRRLFRKILKKIDFICSLMRNLEKREECTQNDVAIRLALMGIFLTLGFSLLPGGTANWEDISFVIRALVAVAFFAMGFIALHDIKLADKHARTLLILFIIVGVIIGYAYGMPIKDLNDLINLFFEELYNLTLLFIGLLLAYIIVKIKPIRG